MRIVHLSDPHFDQGSDFDGEAFEKALNLLNSLSPKPRLVFVSGDVTFNGLLSEYEVARKELSKLNAEVLVVPGNHDERNLGYKLFPEFFGDTDTVKEYEEVVVIGLASSEPDRDEGRLGRMRHRLIQRTLQGLKKTPIIGFHHHLIPIPNSGREANVVEDAGEVLDLILRYKVPLVLMGHRHVPYAVKVHETLLVNAGTISSKRTRARFGHSFNVIDVDEREITVTVVDVDEGVGKPMVRFDRLKGTYTNKYLENAL